jgi:NADH-quinone oxidoreductase subunit L
VIHRLSGEQDIRKMGGLHRYMPRTSIMFLIGTLALMGMPPLSGFWSKDAILASALAEGGPLGWFLYAAGMIGAFLTGMYALRLYLHVFHGEPAPFVLEHFEEGHAAAPPDPVEQGQVAHAHHGHGEGPFSMMLPVAILSIGAIVVGFLDIPGVIAAFANWIDSAAEPLVEPSVAEDYETSFVAVAIGILGGLVAWFAYKKGREIVRSRALWTVLSEKFYFDEVYDVLFSRPAQLLATSLRERVEEPVVQGSLGEIGAGVEEVAGETARLQTGLLRSYALVIAASVAVLVVVFVAVR